MVDRPSGRVTDGRLVQPESTSPPIKRTLSGMVIVTRLSQCENAEFWTCVTLSGMITPVRFAQPANALAPIDITPLGMSTDSMLTHIANAASSISVQVLGMVTSPSASGWIGQFRSGVGGGATARLVVGAVVVGDGMVGGLGDDDGIHVACSMQSTRMTPGRYGECRCCSECRRRGCRRTRGRHRG